MNRDDITILREMIGHCWSLVTTLEDNDSPLTKAIIGETIEAAEDPKRWLGIDWDRAALALRDIADDCSMLADHINAKHVNLTSE